MLTNFANKAKPAPVPVVAAGGRCGLCGLTGRGCRPVPLGYFCQRDGLLEDRSRWLIPDPDPLSVAVHKDKHVVAALEVLEGCEAAEALARQVWVDAVQAAAEAGIRGGEGWALVNQADSNKTLVLGSGYRELPPSPDTDRYRDKVDEARRDLDAASARSAQARNTYTKLVERTRRRLAPRFQ